MARTIDASKLARIHAATMELVVEKGYGGASTASIAKKAGVAEGYLYRFYSSKQSLVVSLLHQKIHLLIVQLEDYLLNYQDINIVLKLFIEEIFQMAEKDPGEIKFIHVLMHDYNFQVADSQRREIKSLCQKLIAHGVANQEFHPSLSPEEVYNMGIVYPIEFINLRMKGFFGNIGWTISDKQRVISFCINSLK